MCYQILVQRTIFLSVFSVNFVRALVSRSRMTLPVDCLYCWIKTSPATYRRIIQKHQQDVPLENFQKTTISLVFQAWRNTSVFLLRGQEMGRVRGGRQGWNETTDSNTDTVWLNFNAGSKAPLFYGERQVFCSTEHLLLARDDQQRESSSLQTNT